MFEDEERFTTWSFTCNVILVIFIATIVATYGIFFYNYEFLVVLLILFSVCLVMFTLNYLSTFFIQQQKKIHDNVLRDNKHYRNN